MPAPQIIFGGGVSISSDVDLALLGLGIGVGRREGMGAGAGQGGTNLVTEPLREGGVRVECGDQTGADGE